ncbi:MAG: nucleotidyltransferase family protein [Opitutaceae bacterium]
MALRVVNLTLGGMRNISGIMHAGIERHREEMARLCRRFGVRTLEMFGSALGAEFTPESDIDFLVEFGEPCVFNAFEQYFGLKEGLEQLLGRTIDLVVASSIRNPVFRAEVERTKQPLYAAA